MDRPLLFGKFCLLERVSVGGMAEVFRAKPLGAPDPNKYFALKRILPHLAEDMEFIKMFVDEARLTVQLRHPNIVHTYELGQFQSSHYIVMEFIAGKDLLAFQKLVRKKNTILDLDMACHIVREIAKGIDFAHRATDDNGQPLGIIHRDISPQNVLVSWDGKVRVIDFGVAKAASQSTKTQAGVLKGKFGYMSPEQVRAKDIDHRSDIFSMGTLLWELLTNQRLFKAGNQYETMMLIGDPDVDPPSTINPAVPPQLDAICMKALAEDRDQRYQSAGKLADDLHAYLMSQKPPYHRSQLTTWLRSAFRDEFDEEKEKRERFRKINTADDVRRLFDESYGEGGGDEDQATEDATQIWDVDVAPDDDVDIESFVSNHTVVAAGGLELSDYEDWEDAPDTIDETRDVVESRIEAATGESLQQIQMGMHDEAEMEATVVSRPSGVNREGGGVTVPSRPDSLGPPPPVGQPATGAQRRISAPADETGSGEFPEVEIETPTPPQGLQFPTPGSTSKSPAKRLREAMDKLPAIKPATRNRIVLITAAVVTFVSLVSLAIFLLGDDDEPEGFEVASGELLVEVSPATQLEIYLDGQWVGRESPLHIDDLEPSVYTVEIDHADYPAWTGEIEVGESGRAELQADLAATGTLTVRWESNPEELFIYIDDRAVDVDEERQELEVELVRGTYVVEAFASGVRPIRQVVTVESGADPEVQLQWIAADELVLTGDEEFEVELDGRVLGDLPLTLEGLGRHRVYTLRIGDVERLLGFPELGVAELDVDTFVEIEDRDDGDFGTLVIDFDGEEPWEIVIDDVETGLITPLEEGLPLAAGRRTVGFQRGQERHDFRLLLLSEETVRFQPAM